MRAACGGQVFEQGLFDLGRVERRRLLGRQCPVGPDGGRGGAQQRALRAKLFARCAAGAGAQGRGRPEPAGDERHLSPRCRDIRIAGAAAPPCVQDGAVEGLSLLGRRNPLEVGIARWRYAKRGGLSLSERPVGLSGRKHGGIIDLCRPTLCRARGFRGEVRRARIGRMGDQLDALARRLSAFLLQYRPHARGRHA